MATKKKHTFPRKFLLLVVTAIFIAGFSTLVNHLWGNQSQFNSLMHYIKVNSYGISFGVGFWVVNAGVGRLIGKKLNWRKNPVKANLISMLAFISGGMLISILIPYVHFMYVWQVSSANLLSGIMSHAFMALAVDLIVISVYYSQYIVSYWGKSIKNEEALKRENLIAEYEALKNQVNPHFLFNTLNTLAGIVEQTPERASKYIHKLSDIYRYVLDQKDKEVIDLKEEMHFVNDYVYLSKMRYGEGLIVKNNLTTHPIEIIPLGLQMLIENAIKHNIISDDEPLTIELGEQDGYIYVRNNLQPKNTLYPKHKVGLQNLIKRYEYLCDKPVLVNITDNYFEVKLPVLLNAEK